MDYRLLASIIAIILLLGVLWNIVKTSKKSEEAEPENVTDESYCPHGDHPCKMDTNPVLKSAEITIRMLKIRKAQEIEGLSPCYCNETMGNFQKITPDMCFVCIYRHTCDCRKDSE